MSAPASLFQIGIIAVGLMMAVGLLFLFAGLAREANERDMRQPDRLSPGGNRMVRWHAWLWTPVPRAVITGFIGTYALALSTIFMALLDGGFAFRIYVAPAMAFETWLGPLVPRAAMVFWGVAIGGISLFFFLRNARRGPSVAPVA